MDVSIICMTYGRSWMLEVAIESYRRERKCFDGTCEMVVVNDMAEQTLCCQLDGVKIVNLKKRFASHNEKTDYAVSLARGEYTCLQDDDDIFLKNRLQWQFNEIKTKNLLVHYLPYAYYTHLNNVTRKWEIEDRPNNLFWTSAMFKTSLWNDSGGCVHATEHNDQAIFRRMRRHVEKIAKKKNMRFEDLWYEERNQEELINTFEIYRWFGAATHLSHYVDKDKSEEIFHNKVVADPRFKSGTIRLVPHYNQDYEKMVRIYNRSGA